MNTFITTTLLFVSIFIGTTTLTNQAVIKTSAPITEHGNTDPYKIEFSLKKQQNSNYQLTVAMDLAEGAYYVSPNSRRNFKGKFKLYINSKEYLRLDRFLVETPASVEIYDEHPFVDGYVNWVAEDTQYSKLFQVLTEKDFFVYGYVQFTIEPRCTLEKIPFVIKQQNGKLVVELDRC